MTDAEKREAAHQFINRWMGRGNEDEDGRSYWLEFLSNVMGMENPTERVNFEKKVIVNGNTKRIDVYIPETHVIIEQKSLGKSLDQKIHNSGDAAVPGEVSPSRLVLREFVGRTLLESLLVLPGLASAVLALFSSEGRTLHDRLSRTIVVQSKGWEEDD